MTNSTPNRRLPGSDINGWRMATRFLVVNSIGQTVARFARISDARCYVTGQPTLRVFDLEGRLVVPAAQLPVVDPDELAAFVAIPTI